MKLRYLLIGLLFVTNVFSQNYHDTNGKLEISNSGQSIYTIPIALPPSIQNIGPTVNLVYASGQFGGIIGQGWNINTISNISRTSTNFNADGFVDGVDFDDSDKLSLDGQRLLSLGSSVYWADGSIYQTETQSNTKIELKGTGTNIYFIVTNPDGSRSWYGNYMGANAYDLNAYYITRFEDNKGNYVIYDYFKPFSRSLCLKEIKFSANINGLSPLNSIMFTYKLAKRVEFSYLKGLKHEKESVLSSVEVFTNNQSFRKYVISHLEDPQLGYEKVIKVQEYNGSNEPSNPINFTYGNSTTSIDYTTQSIKSYINNLPDDKGIPGDYDGDGKLDMLMGKKIFNNLFQGNSGQEPINVSSLPSSYNWPITTTKNGKLVQKSSILNMEIPQLTQLSFKVYNLDYSTNTNLEYNYLKNIEFPNTASCWSNCPWQPCTTPTYVKTGNKYLEGDFNGDGISELLLIGYPEQKTYTYTSGLKNLNSNSKIPDPNADCLEEVFIGSTPNVIRLLDLNPTSSSTLGSKGYVNIDVAMSFYGKLFVMDFNGDGKADILSVRDDKSYTVTGFKQLNAAPWIQLEMLGQGILTDYDKDKIILFGDFNGDSKIDIIIPVIEDQSNWKIYYSNQNPLGGEFFISETHQIVNFKPEEVFNTTNKRWKTYYVVDTNKDGKSDLMEVEISYFHAGGLLDPEDYDTSWKIKTFANNIGNTSITTGSKFTLDYTTPCVVVGSETVCSNLSDSPALPITIVGEFKNQGANNEVVVLNNHYKTITYVNFTKNVDQDNLLIKVDETGTGNVFQIKYAEMEPPIGATGSTSDMQNFYSFADFNTTLNYPNVEILRMPSNFLVQKLTNISLGITKYQDFKYHGFVVNLNGLGTLGFKKTARSSWYLNTEKKYGVLLKLMHFTEELLQRLIHNW